MVDAPVPAYVESTRVHPVSSADAALLPQTLRLDPPRVDPPLWRFALTGLGPLGLLCLFALVTSLRQALGW